MSHALKAVDGVESLQVNPITIKPTLKAFSSFSGAKMPPKSAQIVFVSPVCAPQMVFDEFWKNAFWTHFGPIVCPTGLCIAT